MIVLLILICIGLKLQPGTTLLILFLYYIFEPSTATKGRHYVVYLPQPENIDELPELPDPDGVPCSHRTKNNSDLPELPDPDGE